MKIAYVLFDGITLLDFIGVYDPICRLRAQGHIPDLSWDLCAFTPTVTDGFGLEMKVDKVQPDLGAYDLVIIPGGFGTRSLQNDAPFVEWLRSAQPAPLKASVCTGALLLGAADMLKGRRATTHFNEYQALEDYCATVVQQRIVDDGPVITAGAVASSLDLGLYLCEKLAGAEAEAQIRQAMHYLR